MHPFHSCNCSHLNSQKYPSTMLWIPTTISLPICPSRARRSVGQRANLADGAKRNSEIQLPRHVILLVLLHISIARGR